MNEKQLQQLVAGIVEQLLGGGGAGTGSVPVEVSGRHVHLTQADVEALYGPGHTLTRKRDLSQPGQFLAEERLSIVTPKGAFHHVAVLGPVRDHTQVEISMSDARALGLNPPVRQSGDTAGCPGICLLAGERSIQAEESVMVAQNHIHMTPEDAGRYGVHDGELVQVRMETARPITFDGVVVRVRRDYALAMHIDSDESNACGFQTGGTGRLLRTGRQVESRPEAAPAGQPVRTERGPDCGQVFHGLLSADGAKKIISTCGGALRLGGDAILTPLARDMLREHKITLLREENRPC